MARVLVILVIGMGIGYAYGFADARRHHKPISARAYDRLVGKTTELVERHPRATGSTRTH